jgi:hypothetical protein
MKAESLRFIGEQIKVEFDTDPTWEKIPGCPDRFVWRDEEYHIAAVLTEWCDYRRRGRMARNMSPAHAATASIRGSWGVGRTYFRVRTESGRVFDLYYDRSPRGADDRKGQWFLFREMSAD